MPAAPIRTGATRAKVTAMPPPRCRSSCAAATENRARQEFMQPQLLHGLLQDNQRTCHRSLVYRQVDTITLHCSRDLLAILRAPHGCCLPACDDALLGGDSGTRGCMRLHA